MFGGNYLLIEKKNKFKRQKTVSIQTQIFKNVEKNNNKNIHKNRFSSKRIIKFSKQSFFTKNAFQRIPEKKNHIIQKLNLL